MKELSFVIFSEQEEFAQEMQLRLEKLRHVKVVGVATETATLVELVKNGPGGWIIVPARCYRGEEKEFGRKPVAM